MFARIRLFGLMCLACVPLASSVALAQSLPSGVRSQVIFEGRVSVPRKGPGARVLAQQPDATIAVVQRTWFLRPGAMLEDLRGGQKGYLVVEVRSGILTSVVGGHEQKRHLGEFFVVPAGANAMISTRDRSAIVHTILLPAEP